MTPFAELTTAILSAGTLIADVAIVLAVALFFIKPAILMPFFSRFALLLGLLITTLTTLSSMLYSTVIHFIPCEFCWWQRVFLFPQIIVFAVGLYYQKRAGEIAVRMTLVISLLMSGIGALFAAFQYYGQMFNPDLLAACIAAGISCSKLYFVSFGYITIPMMSLTTFMLLIVVCLYAKKGLNAASAVQS